MGEGGILGEALTDEGVLQDVGLRTLAQTGEEAIIMGLAEDRLLAHVQAEYDLFLEGRADSYLGGFGVYPPVELRRRSHVAGLEKSSPHIDHPLN